MLRDRVLSLRNANIYEPHVYRHLISAIRVRPGEGDAWTDQIGYAVIRTMQDGDASIFSTGKYLDRIAFTDGVPKFEQRIVVFDSRRVHTLMVIPL